MRKLIFSFILFHLQVKGLIAIGDSKSDIDCAPAIKVCAFPWFDELDAFEIIAYVYITRNLWFHCNYKIGL